jgi:D-3-phosphoglycerate dehydrogenase
MTHRGQVFVGTEVFASPKTEPADRLRAEGFEICVNPYGRRLTRQDYASCLEGIEYILAGLEPYDGGVFSAYPKIRVLSRIGIGVDAIDLEAARAHQIAVYNTPEAPSQSVAELTIGLMIGLLRGVVSMDAAFHQGHWRPQLGRELAHGTVGLLGFGRIGGGVAERLQGFGPRVTACDPRWDEAKARRCGVTRVDFHTLLAESDLLSLHLPLDPSTRHLLDGPRLDLMKHGAFLINTSRGGIVDDAALMERLRSGRLGGAALDVFEAEPDPTPYAGVPHLLLSPHAGSHTVEARYRMELGAVNNLLAYVDARDRGVPPPSGPRP